MRYALSLYSKGTVKYGSDSYLENGILSHNDVESYPQQLYHLINKMPGNEWTIMSLNYVYREHKKHPSSKLLETYSDSLFKLVGQINWGIIDFVRTNKKSEIKSAKAADTLAIKEEASSKTDLIANLQKENSFKNYDTAYYKELFVDLFMTDTEFVGKFPAAGVESNNSSGFSNFSSKNKKSKKSKNDEKVSTKNIIQKVLLLEPFYLKIDETQSEGFQYIASDEKQEKYTVTVNDCARLQNFELVTLDPGLISSNDVDKMNDYSVINDWFSEKFDADEDYIPIFNTDDVEKVIAKYGTQYILKTGIVNYKSRKGKKMTYYYGFIYDIKTNKIMYKKQESFKGNDTKDLVNAKVYQTFFELKHLKE